MFEIGSLVFLTSALFSFILMIYIRNHLNYNYANIFTVIVLLTGIWGLEKFILISNQEYFYQELSLKLSIAIIAFLPPLFLILSYKFTKLGSDFALKYKILLFILPAVTAILSFTNDYHHLVFDTNGLQKVFTPSLSFNSWMLVHVGSSFFLLVWAFTLIIRYAIDNYRVYRKQSILLLIFAALPTIVLTLLTFKLFPFRYNYLVLFSFLMSSLIFAYAAFEKKIFNLSPIAHQVIIKNMSDAILVIDNNNNIVDVNTEAEIILLHSANELIGKKIDEFNELQVGLKNSANSDSVFAFEYATYIESKIQFFEVKISPLKKKDNTLGRLFIFHNITERKEHENLLQNLNSAKDKLFSIIGHDLRNPFTSVTGYLKILDEKKELFDEKEKEDIIKKIILSADRASDLLENLLTWARVQTKSISAEKVQINLRRVTKEILELYSSSAKNKNISFNLSIPESSEILFDPFMFSTILRNFISNAIKFSYPDGIIVLSVEDTSNSTKITVKDDGTGITEADLKNLFVYGSNVKRKGTKNESGTGMGLILSKEFAELNSAAIEVKSKEKEGSAFILKVPG